MTTFSTILAAHRTASGMSQANLSRITGLHPSAICRYESGDRIPSRDAVEALAAALGMNREEQVRLLLSVGYVPAFVSRSPVAIEVMTGVVAGLEAARAAAQEKAA